MPDARSGAPVERLVLQDESFTTGAPLSGQFVIAREIAVAEGLFAPGHLGELTQLVPFEMVDAALAGCGAVQQRLRKLPARVVVYLLLAGALFEECGYPAVWARLTAALGARREARNAETPPEQPGENTLAPELRPTYAPGGRPGPASARGGKPRLPAHRMTTATASGAYPFLAEGGLGADGIFIGRDVHAEAAFCYDPCRAATVRHRRPDALKGPRVSQPGSVQRL